MNMNKFGPAVAAFSLAISFAGTSSAHDEHDEKFLIAMEAICLASIGNDGFCGCTREALATHLPPEYASFAHEGLIRPDVPDEVVDIVDEAVLACRDTHVDMSLYQSEE